MNKAQLQVLYRCDEVDDEVVADVNFDIIDEADFDASGKAVVQVECPECEETHEVYLEDE